MNRLAKKTALTDQAYDIIQAHIIDPENSPLPEKLKERFDRVLQIGRLLDDYPNESHVINIMLAKYRVTRTTIRKDLELAREIFKTQHQFDWDFWFYWMLKDQIELIRRCKLNGDFKNWNNAKKTLLAMIGEKPAAVEDPRRMEKNVINLQVNYSGQVINIPVDALAKFSEKDRKILLDSLYQPIDEVQAEEIMNT